MDIKEIARNMLDEQETYLEREMSKDLPEPLDAKPGNVLSATDAPRDLIPALLGELESLDAKAAAEITFYYKLLYGEPPEYHIDWEAWAESHLDDAHWLLEDLFDALGELAPDGHYFGSHPDGADYGFWPCDD